MTKRGEDLQTAQNNSKLLHEMIDQFRPENASSQESDLMRVRGSFMLTIALYFVPFS